MGKIRLGWVKEKISDLFDKDTKIRTVVFEDGKRVTYSGIKWLAKRANFYQQEFARPGTAVIETNFRRMQSAAMKTLCRDRYLQILLESGTYTFDNIFVIRNPYGEAPLAALALFQTSESCAVRVTVKGKCDTEDYQEELPAARLHRVPILGLYPECVNDVRIELLDQKGNILRERVIPIQTRKLPPDLSDLVKIEKMAEKPAFDNILISGGLDVRTFAFDKKGDVRYYMRRQVKGYGVFPLDDGHFYFMEKRVSRPTYSNPTAAQAHDMDYLGRVYKTYFTKKGVHHTIEEKKPGGNLLAGSGTLEGHSEDLVVEIDRENGKVVEYFRMDQLFGDKYIDRPDWAHVNSAVYCAENDSLLISLRNLHSVACIDYATKKLRWIMADPGFWKGTEVEDKVLTLVGETAWFYQQHAAYFLPQEENADPDIRRIIVFDNHWVKRRQIENYDDDNNSYVTIFEVNEKEGTVRLDRRFEHRKAKIRSNAVYCPEQHRVYSMAGMYATPLEGYFGGIYEYDYDTGKCLTRLYVKPGFFRAYEFAPDAAKLTEPMLYDPKTDDYFCGDLERPKKLSEKEAEEINFGGCKRKNFSAKELYMQEDVLFVAGRDHEVEKIYLVGKKDIYMTSFDDTEQTMVDVFGNSYYDVCTWLDELPPDRYELVVKVKGEMVRTDKWIEKL